MKKTKGCLNPKCEANKKRIMYEGAYIRCPMCGEFLSYVCKDCYTKLPNGAHSLCIRCFELRKDKKEKVKRDIEKAGAAVVAIVGPVVVAAVKKGPEIVKKVFFKG